MRQRDYKSKLVAHEMVDQDLRRNVFRSMSSDLLAAIKEGGVTDRAGSFAKLMEAAFKAGQDSAPRNGLTAARPARRFTDMDLTALPRKEFDDVRRYLTRGSNGRPAEHYPEPGHLGLVLTPYNALRVTEPRWLQATFGKYRQIGNRAVEPWIRAGLYEASDSVEDGMRFAAMTEWGFELLMKGETALPEDRIEGRSSTYRKFYELTEGRSMLRDTGRALGFEVPYDAEIEPNAVPGM